MKQLKEYYLLISCNKNEDHDGEQKITKQELRQLAKKCKERENKIDCTQCNLRVVDEKGNQVLDCCKERKN
ncbi:hypothetical protein [Natranaerobius trueperi]|uniref:EF-hand domain-containing protein n=1 Tax=Natranaerobius trueperi TaxID=759412 RepID=A0A226BWX6_9FIRM|nr:hypothetical protein [Natranaerobius trueperi]OWZ83548.1 hypothetical protein CDO51_08065 [Natranaerobius trueperi]